MTNPGTLSLAGVSSLGWVFVRSKELGRGLDPMQYLYNLEIGAQTSRNRLIPPHGHLSPAPCYMALSDTGQYSTPQPHALGLPLRPVALGSPPEVRYIGRSPSSKVILSADASPEKCCFCLSTISACTHHCSIRGAHVSCCTGNSTMRHP